MSWGSGLDFCGRRFPSTALHLDGEEGVKLQPGFFHFRGKSITQSAMEHPDQSRTNRGVLVDLDAIAIVARAEFAHSLTQVLGMLQV